MPSRRHNEPRWAPRAALAIGFLTAMSLALAAQSTLWDRDEPQYARVACEMLQSGNWMVPRVNGEVFAYKPPLAFWAMAVSMALFGVNELAVRLPSILSLSATGWLVFLMGRRLFSSRTGLWAAMMLMSAVMAMFLGSAAMLDAPLLAFITLAMYAHLKGLHEPRRWYVYWPVMALALGLSQLTKFPVGMATTAPAMFLSTWLLRKEMQVPRTYWLGLFLAFLAGYGFHQAWFVPVANAVPGFAAEIHGHNLLYHIFAARHGQGASTLLGYLALLPVYVPVLAVGFAPWSVFLPCGIWASMGNLWGNRKARVFIVSWGLPIFLSFSLCVTKLPHYIFPVFPPAAILAAGTLEAWRNGDLNTRGRQWLRFGGWILTFTVIGFALALVLPPFLPGRDGPGLSIILPPLLLLTSSIIAVRLIFRDQVLKAAYLLLLGSPLMLLLAARLTLPTIEPLIKASPLLAQTIQWEYLHDEPIAMCGYREPSFFFYMNLPADQSVELLPGTPRALNQWAHNPKPGWLVVYDALWQEMVRSFGPAPRCRTRNLLPVLNTNDHARRDSVRVIRRTAKPQGQDRGGN